MQRYKGLKKLVHDVVGITTDIVEEVNESVASQAMGVIEQVGPLAKPARAVDRIRKLSAKGIYESIHGVNHIVSRLGDMGIDKLAADAPGDIPVLPMRSDCTTDKPWMEDAAIGTLNGVVGDYLHDKGNALDLGMQLRLGDEYVAPQDIDAKRVALFLHGVCVTEWGWCMNAEDYHGDPAANFGTMLERDHGYTPVFLRYNTGRHISHNGRQLALLLDGLDCEELVLVGHSMGGLVARSACYYGDKAQRRWPASLSHVFCLGSPHLGAPLEKAGNVLTSILGYFDVAGTQIPARVLNSRSAGIKDLRFGYLIDEDWEGREIDALLENNRTDLPLLEGVTYAFISTTLTHLPDHPVGELLGDLMVRRGSASGPITSHESFDVHSEHITGVMHHEIQSHPDVYARILGVLGSRRPDED